MDELATSPCSMWQSIPKLRGCNVVALKIEDIAPNGHAIDRAMVQNKLMSEMPGQSGHALPVLELTAVLKPSSLTDSGTILA